MPKRRIGALAAAGVIAALAVGNLLASSSGSKLKHVSKFSPTSVLAQTGKSADTAGEGPNGGYEAYLAASRTYPPKVIPPQVAQRAEVAFEALAKRDAVSGDPGAAGRQWQHYGPKRTAPQPGVLAFSGATNQTASRITALVVSPKCTAKTCVVWAGAAGGGVWKTDFATAGDPQWNQIGPDLLEQNSVGSLTIDPTDASGQTLYLGTGEGNRCSSGCEAGVGIYKSTNGGSTWTKLSDTCVSNASYACATPGKDAFLGRGINAVVIDPTNKNHIYVGSALGIPGLAHVIGNGAGSRAEPGANAPGLYESTDGGATFQEVWNANDPNTFGVTQVLLDPTDPHVVYATAYDQGLWRRDAGAPSTGFVQIFKPQFASGGNDRTSIALATKNGHTRIYLGDGTNNGNGVGAANAANFWRTDMGDQPSAALLASQAAGHKPPPGTHHFPTPQT